MDQDRGARLKELVEARDKLQRQIEIIITGSPFQAMNRKTQVDGILRQLRDTLATVKQCIIESERDDA